MHHFIRAIALPLALLSASCGAATLEQFLTDQALGRAGLSTYHKDARGVVLSKDMVFSLDREKIGKLLKAQRDMQDNAQIEAKVLDFKILGKTESPDAISVVSYIKLSVQMLGVEGAEPIVTETTSHDVLLKMGNTYLSIFSLSRDDGSMAALAGMGKK